MACYTEIFQENISREYIAGRQVLYGISPVKDSTDSFSFIGFLQKDIQRYYPAFHIGMLDDDAIFCNPYRLACPLL